MITCGMNKKNNFIKKPQNIGYLFNFISWKKLAVNDNSDF